MATFQSKLLRNFHKSGVVTPSIIFELKEGYGGQTVITINHIIT